MVQKLNRALTKMRFWNHNFNLIACAICVKHLDPEQTPTMMVDKVITADCLICIMNQLQDKLDVIRERSICGLSCICKISQNLIWQLCYDPEFLAICLGINSLLGLRDQSENVAARSPYLFLMIEILSTFRVRVRDPSVWQVTTAFIFI